MGQLQLVRDGYLVISVLSYGAAAGYLPDRSLPPAALCRFVGSVLLAYVPIRIIGVFSNDLSCLAFQHDLGNL